MRSRLYVILGVLLLAALVSACGGVASAQTQPPATPTPRTLAVTGTGKVFVSPDIATISIGVHTEGKNAAEAVTSNNAQSLKVTQALKAMGVDEKDIQTSNFSIYPQQQFDDQGKVTGTIYIVDNTVYVTVRDLDNLGELLDTAVSSGANSIYGIQFDVEEKEKALSEARQKAVENAHLQAEELASAAGVTLGEVQTISTYGSVPIPVFEGKGGGAMEAAAQVPISAGQLSVMVDVNIVYEIK